jgi:glycosyltransferase involved in cell wall biosynthesis
MRICLDVSQSVYEGTGSGRYVIELIKGLMRQSEAHEYMLFGSAFKKKADLDVLSEAYKLVPSSSTLLERYYPFPPALMELFWNRLHALPIEWLVGNADIYHSSDWTQAPSNSKLITTVHDLIPFLFPEHVHPRIREAHELRWKHIVKDDVEIIVDAESTKRDIVDRFKLPSDKIHVIPLACSNHFFEVGRKKIDQDPTYLAEQEKVLKGFGLSSNSYILAVGTLEPRKNIHKLIEAYNRLPAAVQEQTKIVIVGKKAWAADLPISANTILTGYVEESALPYLYSGSKTFVMPSLYEGFGIPILEAMACATPVICSQTSSLPEIGGDAVHYIQDPTSTESIGTAILSMLEKSDGELGIQAKKGYDRATLFSWERTARETLEVYKNL